MAMVTTAVVDPDVINARGFERAGYGDYKTDPNEPGARSITATEDSGGSTVTFRLSGDGEGMRQSRYEEPDVVASLVRDAGAGEA